MPAKSKRERVERSQQRQDNYRKRVPLQPDGYPQGKHRSGFKGMAVNEDCFCGGCLPKNREKWQRVVS